MKLKLIYNLKFLIVGLIAGCFIPDISFAQPHTTFRWSVDGNIRYRFDKWQNMNARYYGSNPEIGKPNDNILLQRIIAGTTINLNNHITISAHFQDSRAFGWSLQNELEPDAFKIHAKTQSEPYYKMNPQEEFFEIYDLNIQVDSILNYFSIILGRQKIAFNDYRMFGPGTWGNTGRWNWDALKITYKREDWTSTIWVGGTKIHDPEKTHIPFTNTEYYGGGFHNTIKFGKYLNTDIYYAHKNQGSADYIKELKINRNWAGFRIYSSDYSNWIYEASYNHEFGKEEGSGINAFGTFIKFGYQFKQINWEPRFTLRHTFASGDRSGSETIESYDPAYGAMDRYYGWMNIMKWTNMDNWEFMFELFPFKGAQIEVKVNDFFIPEPENVKIKGNLQLPEGKNHLGTEFDIFMKYNFSTLWQCVVALGIFFPMEAEIEDVGKPPDAYWASFQILYNFSIWLKK